MSVVINTAVAGGAGTGTSGSVDYTVREETGTSFTLTNALHANRRVDAANAAAIAVTWNTGHGMTEGACGRIMQAGDGAITLSAGTGTVRLAPNVTSAVTTAKGSWIDWEYLGDNDGGTDVLVVTGVGVAGSGGATIDNPTFERFYDGTSNRSPLSTNNVKLARFVFTQARMTAAGGVSMVFAINGGGSTDTLISGIRWGAAGTAFSAMTVIATCNAGSASAMPVLRVTAGVSAENANNLIVFNTTTTQETSNSVVETTGRVVLDMTALGGADVEFAVGGNVGATDRPWVDFGLAFFPVN